MGTRFAIVGDIHGRFEDLADALDRVRGRWGGLGFVLAVGDVEPNRGYEDHLGVVGPPRYRKVGDFPRVAAGDVSLGAPLYFIAGNHDPYQPNGLWDQLRARELPDNIHAHTEPEATIIEQDAAVLFPAPLQYRRTLNDPTAWMDNQETKAGLIRIGLAHGAVHVYDANKDHRANPIDSARPQFAQLDYLALGDWHGELKVNERCWYSGTPETDSFQTRGRGTVLLVEIDGPGELPTVTVLSTGQYRWESLNERVENLADVDLLENKLRSLDGDFNRTLVDLRVSGSLSLADLLHFEERIVEGTAAAFCHLRIDREQLFPEPTDDDLDSIDPGGIVRAAADRLRAIVEAGGSDADLAREAIRRLYIEHKKLESGLR